jgi:hypothetical protein
VWAEAGGASCWRGAGPAFQSLLFLQRRVEYKKGEGQARAYERKPRKGRGLVGWNLPGHCHLRGSRLLDCCTSGSATHGGGDLGRRSCLSEPSFLICWGTTRTQYDSTCYPYLEVGIQDLLAVRRAPPDSGLFGDRGQGCTELHCTGKAASMWIDVLS